MQNLRAEQQSNFVELLRAMNARFDKLNMVAKDDSAEARVNDKFTPNFAHLPPTISTSKAMPIGEVDTGNLKTVY